MRIIHYIFLFSMVLSVLAGCQKSLAPQELVEWVENDDNGLKHSKEIEKIKYTVQYRPLEYVVAKEKRKNDLQSEELTERLNAIKGAQYFSMRINKVNGTEDVLLYGLANEQDYYQRANYCNAAMADDISLIQGNDTLHCTLFQFVPTYGVAPYADFVMAFEDKNYEGDKVFVLNDRLFGAGELQFKIENKVLKNIPEIITK